MQRVDLDLLERRIPDVVSTDDVPDLLAAEVDFLASRHERWMDSPTAAPVVRARAMVAAGAIEQAREIIDRLDLRRLTDGEALVAAWAVSRCGSASRAHDLLDRLTVVADDFVVDPVPYGPVALGIGQLHGVLGQVDDALEALRRAVSVADGRLPMWGALARVELARRARLRRRRRRSPGGPCRGRSGCDVGADLPHCRRLPGATGTCRAGSCGRFAWRSRRRRAAGGRTMDGRARAAASRRGRTTSRVGGSAAPDLPPEPSCDGGGACDGDRRCAHR